MLEKSITSAYANSMHVFFSELENALVAVTTIFFEGNIYIYIYIVLFLFFIKARDWR